MPLDAIVFKGDSSHVKATKYKFFRHYLMLMFRYQTNDPTNISGAFPCLDTCIHDITINAKIFLSDNLDLKVSYIYENYDSSNWVWKYDFGGSGTTYFDTLNYGYESPNYITQVFQIGANYQF